MQTQRNANSSKSLQYDFRLSFVLFVLIVLADSYPLPLQVGHEIPLTTLAPPQVSHLPIFCVRQGGVSVEIFDSRPREIDFIEMRC
ncbi:hypothetical protein B0T19DRAFT_425177 [Cercophora scortea]|uniref:Uncharacterized protein n=1 Tax=Cercophora scortea TaxID=314031 RepID=A0AAE0IPC1_9PEZI|nr:hypothetical protein B0T19DRAFT_425177 [Cercophora scortea]